MNAGRLFVNLIFVALITLVVQIFPLGAKGIEKKVNFQKGASSQVVEGSLVRGDQDAYIVNAKASQTLTVFIGSLEDNAVFSIIDMTTKKPLKGTEEGADAKRWVGPLPSSGDYKIIVSGTRGNATYIMKIEI